MSRSWCNFCEENHEESTCEVKKSVRDKIFGKKPKTTIVVLDWAKPKDVMIINSGTKFMLLKENTTLLVLLPLQPHLHKVLMYKLSKFIRFKEFLPFFPLPSITFLTNWLTSRLMLLFWTWLPSLNNKSISRILWKEKIPP